MVRSSLVENVHFAFQPFRVAPVSRAGILVLVAIALLAGLWRAAGLERDGLNMDEINQAKVVRGGMSYDPPTSLWNPRSWITVAAGAAMQQQPPLAYLLQRLPNQVSSSDAAQRSLACVCGTIGVFLTGLLGALLGGIRVGTVSALLISVSPLHIELSRYARPYAIAHVFWLLTVMVAYWAYRANTRRGWILLAVTAFLFLTTRGDLPLFALSAIGTVFLMARCWKGIMALFAAGIAYLPIFTVILRDGRDWVGKPVPVNWLLLLREIIALADPLPVVLLPLALLGVWTLRSQVAARSFISLWCLTLAFHLVFWFALITWPLNARYIDYCSTPLAILGAFGFWFAMAPLSRFRGCPSFVFAILFAVLAVLEYRIEQFPATEGWRDAALLAERRGIDHIWMFKAGQFLQATPLGFLPIWIPEFYGDWYRPIAHDNPFDLNSKAPTGKLAFLVLQDPPYDSDRGPLLDRIKQRLPGRLLGVRTHYDSIRDPLLEVEAFDHLRFYNMDMYVPRRTCGPRCTLDSVLTVLSRQSGYPDLRREALRLMSKMPLE